MPKTLQELRERYSELYKNAVFFFLDEQYRLGDDPKEEQPVDSSAMSE